MNRILVVACLSGMVACSNIPSKVDQSFGKSLQHIIDNQSVNTDITEGMPKSLGMDGQAAKSSIDRYQKSFDTPPLTTPALTNAMGSR